MDAIQKTIQRHQFVSYFVLAIAISSLLWLPLILNHTTGDATSGPLWWLHYVGGIGPALAAIIVSWIIGGKSATKRLLSRLTWSRKQSRWILLGAVLPVILLLAVIIVIGIFTGKWIQLADVTQTAKLPGIGLAGILFFEIVFFGFGEELGWRGFAWPRLREKFGFFMSSVVVTMPWVLWHTATFFYNDNMMKLGVGGTIGWAFSLLTGAIILGWLTDRAKGSILPAVLFHGVLDVVFVSKAVAGTYDSYLGAAIMVCSVVVALSLMLRAGTPNNARAAQ